jgi:hypothetical protein
MAGNREGPLASVHFAGVHLDLARAVRLDPHGRVALADVSEEGSEEESGHSEVCTTSAVRGRCAPPQRATPVPHREREVTPGRDAAWQTRENAA